MSKQPSVVTSFIHSGKKIYVEWFDLTDEDIPNLPWQQVYAIGNLNGLVPIVHYNTGDSDNLPGGKVEPNELVEHTLKREIQEEINCKVLYWEPLGFQKLTEPDGKVVYQLRVFAILSSLGDFVKDTGGSVVGYSLVDLSSLNDRIQYGRVGERMVELAEKVFEDYSV